MKIFPIWLLLTCSLMTLSVAALADSFTDQLSDMERAAGGRFGVAVTNAQGDVLLGYRATEKFALCSTFKLPLAGLMLKRIDLGKERADRHLPYATTEVLDYAPVAKRYLHSGYLTVAEANRASVQLSDNTAANLLLASVGGPAALTQFLRQLGDKSSRLDRTEPTLNTNLPDDPRDTTSPQAMAQTIAKLVFAEVLKPASKQRLQRLLIGNTTGASAIRAGLPDTWLVGDKTGSCERGGRNDVAFVVPPSTPAFVLTVYTNLPTLAPSQRNAVIADVAALVVRELKP